MTYRLAPGVERVEVRGGAALLARTPLRLVRLNGALAELLRAGEGLAPQSSAEARVLDALLEKGLLIRERGAGPAAVRLPFVSVVIPVMDRAEELRRCLESIGRVRYPRERFEILVVDDGSRDETPQVARALGASVVASGGRGRGPAAARNRGAAAARGEILAFIDSDCTASEEWLVELAERFEASEVVAVGGRVEGMCTSSALDRYEAEMSSLCLGARERSGQAGDDTFYLPGCNLLVRRREFAAAGGFREELRVGEDVDLSWRLRDRGGKIVYTPRGRVFHAHRNRVGAFLRRRFEYGTSEGLLQARHPRRRKRMVLPRGLATSALLVALSFLIGSWWPAAAGAGVVLLDAARLGARLRRQEVRLHPWWVVWARLRAWASLVYYVAFHLVRYYAPVLVVVGIVWPRVGMLVAALAIWSGVVDFAVRRPALTFQTFLCLYVTEHVAYGAGVFCGCVRQGTFGSYRPVFSSSG